MLENRWIINKFGLYNFWYYDDEQFETADGKLLLRGNNGSGKSVTTQSFIPFVLDGNRQPSRLDPFGTSHRKIANYLLEEDDTRDERTGYLYIEFNRMNSDTFMTVGVGIRAVKNKKPSYWYFCINDGRRVNIDFLLYKPGEKNIALSHTDIVKKIGDGGWVTTDQKKYANEVNKTFFGYEDYDDYDNLLTLLIQLRTPKLSKDLKPTTIYGVMLDSLPQLSDDDLRPMTEAIENMDNMKLRLSNLESASMAAEEIKKHYEKYNEFILFDKAQDYIKNNKAVEKITAEIKEITEQLEATKSDETELRNEIETLTDHEKKLSEKISVLSTHKSFNASREKENLESELVREEEHLEDKLSDKVKLENNLREKSKSFEDAKYEKEKLERRIKELNDELESLAEEFGFDEYCIDDEVALSLDRYDFSYEDNRLKQFSIKLKEILELYNTEVKLSKEVDEAYQEKDSAFAKVRSIEKELETAENMLFSTKEEVIEKIFFWKQKLKELILNDPDIIKLNKEIMSFDERYSSDKIKTILGDARNAIEVSINSETGSVNSEIMKIKSEIDNIDNEINKLKNADEIEPQRSSAVINNRKRLEEKHIPFIPFYKAVDFQKHTSDSVKAAIESSLVDMGLIDALIIPEKYKSEALLLDRDMADKYIFSKANFMKHNMSSIIRVDLEQSSDVPAEVIDDVLRSIYLESNENIYVDEMGFYGLGIIKGKATLDYSPILIGEASRKKHRLQRIAELESEVSTYTSSLNDKYEEIDGLNKRREMLKEEISIFPELQDVYEGIRIVKLSSSELETANKTLGSAEEKHNNLLIKHNDLKKDIFFAAKDIRIHSTQDAYKKSVESCEEYKDKYGNLKNVYNSLWNKRDMIKLLESTVIDIEENLQNVIEDITDLERAINTLKNKINEYEEILKMEGYEEIKLQLENYRREIKPIPEEIGIKRQTLGNKESEVKRLSKDIETKLKLSEKAVYLLNEYKRSLIDELNLGYMKSLKIDNPYEGAMKICNIFKFNEKTTKESLFKSLSEAYNKNLGYLREYTLKFVELFDEDINTDEDEEIKSLKLKRRRMKLTTTIQSIEVDFINLVDNINEDIMINKDRIRAKDRELFQEILVKNISKKIGAKIRHAKEWVSKMNTLMSSMDESVSSGLSLQIKWEPKKAEMEGQIDVVELIDLLGRHNELLREADIDKMVSHFSSKLTEARRELDDSGNMQTFLAVVKETLDYRKWFDFSLHSCKPGEKMRELTDSRFFKYSGGEKALSLYIPLFAAIYARLQGARKDCPRIISLDEAFAGVDNNNINMLFSLMEELKLDYILNSQVLWGEYESVSKLNIVELVRPLNETFVTVARFRWNGKVRKMVFD